MKLYIPDIGDRITLSKDWNFDLYEEYRNVSLLKEKGIPFTHQYGDPEKVHNVSLAKGNVLIVDRIYIRKGKDMGDFSSVSFRIEDKKKVRFWVKLKDVNNIEFDETQTIPSLRTKKLSLPGPSEFRFNHILIFSDYSFHTLSKENYKKVLEMVGKKIKMIPSLNTDTPMGDPLFHYDPRLWIGAGEYIDKSILKCKNNSTPKTLKIEFYTEIKSGERISNKNLFGIETDISYKVKREIYYKLLDEDKELGEWKTPESMLKFAKTYLSK